MADETSLPECPRGTADSKEFKLNHHFPYDSFSSIPTLSLWLLPRSLTSHIQSDTRTHPFCFSNLSPFVAFLSRPVVTTWFRPSFSDAECLCSDSWQAPPRCLHWLLHQAHSPLSSFPTWLLEDSASSHFLREAFLFYQPLSFSWIALLCAPIEHHVYHFTHHRTLIIDFLVWLLPWTKSSLRTGITSNLSLSF